MEFHHIGVACENLDRERAAFEVLGYQAEGGVFSDPIQGISGLFLVGAGPRIELVAPLDGSSAVLTGILRQRIKLYHMAYLTPDMAQGLAELQRQRAKVVSPPQPAVAFDGRLIAFAVLPNRLLIELIEMPQASATSSS